MSSGDSALEFHTRDAVQPVLDSNDPGVATPSPPLPLEQDNLRQSNPDSTANPSSQQSAAHSLPPNISTDSPSVVPEALLEDTHSEANLSSVPVVYPHPLPTTGVGLMSNLHRDGDGLRSTIPPGFQPLPSGQSVGRFLDAPTPAGWRTPFVGAPLQAEPGIERHTLLSSTVPRPRAVTGPDLASVTAHVHPITPTHASDPLHYLRGFRRVAAENTALPGAPSPHPPPQVVRIPDPPELPFLAVNPFNAAIIPISFGVISWGTFTASSLRINSPPPSASVPPSQRLSIIHLSSFIFAKIPQQIHLIFLLRLPLFYFSRVSRVFDEADLTIPDIERMAVAAADQWKDSTRGFLPSWQWQVGEGPVPANLLNFRHSWEDFIDSLIREWKTQNIVSALLLS